MSAFRSIKNCLMLILNMCTHFYRMSHEEPMPDLSERFEIFQSPEGEFYVQEKSKKVSLNFTTFLIFFCFLKQYIYVNIQVNVKYKKIGYNYRVYKTLKCMKSVYNIIWILIHIIFFQ